MPDKKQLVDKRRKVHQHGHTGPENGGSLSHLLDSYLAIADIDDTPVDNETSAAISSNWAYDHNAAKTGVHGAGAGSLLATGDVDDTPADGATTDPVSSNWAYDHAAAKITTAHSFALTEVAPSASAQSNNTQWDDWDISGTVVAGSIVIVWIKNKDIAAAREAGVRKNGSSVACLIDIPALQAVTMLVQTDGSGIIERYSEDYFDIDFYIMGYMI